jgi:hypothetical protein
MGSHPLNLEKSLKKLFSNLQIVVVDVLLSAMEMD